ncbi:T9SS type A sorting domain-containing protein, partial [Candidatus Bipolaricaulota bacterium]|nr:T9SS type A sorting domain-containing protein [Candidatus Bipolaricaulota bacterium]
EYVLSVAASRQKSMVNDDVFLIDDGFRQVVLRDSDFPGMYSLWYTSPVSFAAGDYAFQGTVEWSSFLHEMGHNFTLNFPADYYFGGKIDGCANAIYSETMGQIFQHATAHEMINQGAEYGLSADLVFDIRQSAIQSIGVVRDAYERYVSEGMNFASWNDPDTPEDETFDTFMTLAYKFCEHAETEGEGYHEPTARMTRLLSLFDEDLQQRYDQHNNTAEADTFRATLMVTAQSFAFETDLRDEFRDLNFPISDSTYEELLAMMMDASEWAGGQVDDRIDVMCFPNPLTLRTTMAYRLPGNSHVSLRVYDLQGREVCSLVDRDESPGWHQAYWQGVDGQGRDVATGVYVIRLSAGSRAVVTKAVVLR